MKKDKVATMASSPREEKMEDEGKIPQDYEIEDAARTLTKAEEIKKDKRLMPHVHKHLKGKMKAIRSIQDLKDARDQMASKDDDGDND